MASKMAGPNVKIGTLLKSENLVTLGWFLGGFQFDQVPASKYKENKNGFLKQWHSLIKCYVVCTVKQMGSQKFSRDFIKIVFLGIKINILIGQLPLPSHL